MIQPEFIDLLAIGSRKLTPLPGIPSLEIIAYRQRLLRHQCARRARWLFL